MVKVIDTETIIVNKREYQDLVDDSRFLACLRAGGVDNWDWYDEAVRDYYDAYGNENGGDKVE